MTKTKDSPGKWRLELCYGLLVLAMGGLGYRLYQLVTVTGARAQRMVQREQWMTIPEPGKPGGVYVHAARAIIPVAESRQVPSVFVDPNEIDEHDLADTAIRLGAALHMDPVRVQEKIILRRNKRFAWIKREVEPLEANAVRALHLRWAGISYEWQRQYPNGTLAGSVVGFEPADDPNIPSGAGIEKRMHEVMQPEDGYRTLVSDVRRRSFDEVSDQCRPPRDGSNVILFIDASIQGFLEKAVADAVAKNKAKWAAGIVVNPSTGEILAMCSVPNFNPNDFAHADPNQRTNRVITVPYEPGSVAKPIFASAAVDARVVSFDTMIYCENGTYSAPRGGTISDHGSHYGMLSVRDGVVFSSNICMAKVGEKLGNQRIHEIALRFGLGQMTGVDLPGESKGILRDLRKWDGYSLRRVPFGQEISTTTIQLAMAFSALVNGGELLRPRLVDRILDSDRRIVREYPRSVVRRAISPGTSAQALSVMTDVVERGTGAACQLSRWTSFGKTGTAQIPGPRGYIDHAFVASFVGGAPARSPKALCLISVYWPNASINHFGAKVSAPAVKEVLEQTMSYLDVPPDRTVSVATASSE